MKAQNLIIIGILIIISFLFGSMMTAQGFMNNFFGIEYQTEDLSPEIERLQAQYDQLEQKVAELEEGTISETELNRITALETKVAGLEEGILTESEVIDLIKLTGKVPDYDSGWIDTPSAGLAASKRLYHNLDTTSYIVYLWGAYWDGNEWHYHQDVLGHLDGFSWIAYKDSILLFRGEHESKWVRTRVVIYKIPQTTADIL